MKPTQHPTESAREPASTTSGPIGTLHPLLLLIDAKAAQTLLSIGQHTLWSLTKCGAIPSRKIGRSVRYSPTELQAWIDAGCPTDAGAGDRVRAAMREGARR